MKFIEAAALAASAPGYPVFRLALRMSGMAETLLPFLKAEGVLRGFDLRIEVTPFGTLGQTLHAEAGTSDPEAFVLFPWDFIGELDWRMGLSGRLDDEAALRRARSLWADIAKRRPRAILFVDAPVPPMPGVGSGIATIATEPRRLATEAGAVILGPEIFSLGSYLASGAAVGGARQSTLASALAAALFDAPRGQGKVLVSDFDNVLWAGTVADDGPADVVFGPEGRGYRHCLYQGLLKRLKASGVLLAGVSRNDLGAAVAPLARSDSPLRAEDFVAVRAGYGSKSAEIRLLAETLGLGLDSFLFIDDNEVELAEVAAALPEVRRLRFPVADDALPEFLAKIAAFFHRTTLTDEDRDRTALYRRRLETAPAARASRGDIGGFLRDLAMRLKLRERGVGDFDRALQLLNKTNQFNANGQRLDAESLRAALASGGRLFTATLEDRTGSHGEILACLVDASGEVGVFVMSCRVLERRVEFAFIRWLAERVGGDLSVRYRPTDRNEPFARFLRALGADSERARSVVIDRDILMRATGGDADLFVIDFETSDRA